MKLNKYPGILLLALSYMPLAAVAQTANDTPLQNVTTQVVNTMPQGAFKYGYLSYNAVFQAMPEYEKSQQKLQELKAKYDAEAKRAEDEFQRKFAEFIQDQKDMPENILLKRQNELQELMNRNVAFKTEAQSLLTQAEKDLQADMTFLLNEAIKATGIEQGLAFILNTDGGTCPYINPSLGVDVTTIVKQKLGLK